MKEFKFNEYGKEKILTVGQKVECIYYHESIQNPMAWFQPFKPVKFGIIVGDAGVRPYYLAGASGKEQYLYVRFKEYLFKKAIPISCIHDAESATQKLKQFIENNKHKVGQKGYSIESFISLSRDVERGEKFTK